MASINDGSIAQAYADVRADNNDTNWLLITYESDDSNNLILHKTGSGGLSEFTEEIQNLPAAFGFLRFMVGNDELSKRAKFVFVSWSGPGIKIMRKAKLSVHVADVKKVIKDFAVQIGTDDISDLKEDEIVKLLKKAMGANYDRQSSDY